MSLVDIKNYLQSLLKLGYGNTSQTPIPTAAFPLDGRTYFESYDKALAAAELAEKQGSSNTIFYFGMTLVVYNDADGTVDEYVIVKDTETGKGTLRDKSTGGGGMGDITYLIIDGGTTADIIDKTSTELVLMEAQDLPFDCSTITTGYYTDTPAPFEFDDGGTYRIIWDDTEGVYIAQQVSSGIGIVTDDFSIVTDEDGLHIVSLITADTHTVGVTKIV